MSINIEKKVIDAIYDCRSMDYLEVMGLILHIHSFYKEELFNFNINNINGYSLGCNLEEKSIHIDFFWNKDTLIYTYIIFPKEEKGILIQCNDHLKDKSVDIYINMEDLWDLTI